MRPASVAPQPALRARWRTPLRAVGADLTYLVAGFALSLASFVLLVTLFALGVGTLIIWVGAPILAVMLVTATGFARENRELLRRWGSPVAEPDYRGRSGRRVLSMLADPQAWAEALHGTLVAFPLRITTFVLSVTWVATAVGGLTWFAWGHFIPRGEYDGLAWLLVTVTGMEEPANWYLLEASTSFVVGGLLLVLAPLVTRACVLVDVSIARALIGGWVTGADRGVTR